MKIAFYTFAGENVGIGQLIAALKNHGHNVRLFCDPLLFSRASFNINFFKIFSKFTERKIIPFKPDLLAISCTSMDLARSLMIAEYIKKQIDIPVVIGGIHATLSPDSLIRNKYIDFVFQGEADQSFPDFINKFSEKKPINNIGGIWYKTQNGEIQKGPDPVFPENLDALPWPDKDAWGWPVTKSPEYRIQTSRDCPFQCSFCCVHYHLKKLCSTGNRRRSPEHVLAELEHRYLQYRFKYIQFYDAVFPLNKKWLKSFSSDYKKKISLPFSCQAHPEVIDRETVSILKDMNCREITIGIQTLNENIRTRWLNRKYSNGQIKDALDLCENAGLKFNVDHIVDLPGSSIEDLFLAARLYRSYRNLIRFKSFHLLVFPGTLLFDNMNRAGLLNEDDLSGISEGIYDTFGRKEYQARQFGKQMEIYPVLPDVIKGMFQKIPDNKAISNALHLLFLPSHFVNIFRQDYPSYKIYLYDRVLSLLKTINR